MLKTPEFVALQTLNTYCGDDSVFPINVYEIATKMGITVYETNKLPNSICGIYSMYDEAERIYLDVAASAEAKRSTAARLIGHAIRLPGQSYMESVFAQEHEGRVFVEEFAASLLIPAYALNEFTRTGNMDIVELSDFFGVTNSLMWVRLQQLGSI